ncbi:MAG: hypothetical protein K5779_05725 [Saccharofermentans sp.]|nr:hypothetical protein [Saccharofermentans sp.]
MDTVNSISKKKSSNERTLLRIVFGILFLFLTFCVVNPRFQNDTYYIIKLGEQLLDSGIDRVDHWAWSAQLINTYPHFLFNIILAVLYRMSGLAGIYVFELVVVYLFALSLYYLTEKVYDKVAGEKDMTLYPIVGIIVSAIVLLTFSTFMAARPQILSYLLWLWEAWFILCLLNTGKKRYAVAVVVIAWLCAMIHATAWYFTFVLFVPFIAAVYITKLGIFLSAKGIKFDSFLIIDRLILSNDSECKNVLKLWIILPVSYATGLLTPTRLCYTSIFKASSGSTVKYITEHKPLVLANAKYVLIGVILFVVLLAFFKVKCRLDLLLLFGGTMYMALNSNRHVGLLVYLGWFALFYLIFGALVMIPVKFREGIRKTIIPALAILVPAVLGLANNRVQRFSFYDSEFVCDEAIDYLKENYDVQELRLFNDYSAGAYLLFRDVPVFIDSRVNEYTKEFDPTLERNVFDDYMSVISLREDWREIVEYYDFDGYLIARDGVLNEMLSVSPDVEKVWEDDNMVIYMTVRDE